MPEQRLTPGLYLVGTPIGNLEDITLRALRMLRGVDRVLCEDTRETAHLLAHYEIQVPLQSCDEHKEHACAADAVARVRAGERLALVSDAGLRERLATAAAARMQSEFSIAAMLQRYATLYQRVWSEARG